MSKTLFGGLKFFIASFLIALTSQVALAVTPHPTKIYISGNTGGTTNGSNIVKNPTAMKVGHRLYAYFTYFDPEGNAQTGVEYQWYTYDGPNGSNEQPIVGATFSNYEIPIPPAMPNLVGKHIGVKIRVRDASGWGNWITYKPFNVSTPNPVLGDGVTCQKPNSSDNPTPGNEIRNPSLSQCSPRQLTWRVQYTGINWRNNASADQRPKIIITWGDGTVETLDPGLKNTITLAQDAGLYNEMATPADTLALTNMALQNWRVERDHTYNYATATVLPANPERCTFQMSATWGQGPFNCSVAQTQKFVVWDREDRTTLGTLDMGKTAASGGFEPNATAEILNICPFDRSVLRLQDNSDFNCTPGGAQVEGTNFNNQGRWVQFVYGTNVTMNSGTTTAEKFIIDGHEYVKTDFPIYGPVTYVAAGAGNPSMTPSAVTVNMQMPTTALVNTTFEITMRTWNTCHPFDNNVFDGGTNPDQTVQAFDIYAGTNAAKILNPPGALGALPYYANATPATHLYNITIVNGPNPPAVTYNPTGDHCETDANSTFQVTAPWTANNSTMKWYDNAGLTNPEKSQTGNGPATSSFNPTLSADANPTLSKPTTATMRTILYYVTETWPGANGCTSLPTTVTMRITDAVLPGSIDHPNEIGSTQVVPICSGGDPAPFTGVAGLPSGNGTVTYQWQSATAAAGPFTDISGETGLTYDPPNNFTTTRWYRRKASSGFCQDMYTATYQIRVDTPVLPGSINGGGQIICENGDATTLGSATLPTGGDGATYAYQWEFSITGAGGPYNTVPGGVITQNATYDPPAGSITQTTHFRRRVISGVCNADGPDAGLDPDNTAYSTPVQVTVHNLNDPGQIGNPQTICSGDDPSMLTSVTLASGGDGTNYVYQWQSGPSATGPWTDVGANSPTYDPGPITAPGPGPTNVFYQRRVRSPGPVTTTCPEQFSNVIQITVNPLPGGEVRGGGSICSPPPTDAPDIEFHFDAGSGPWDLTYSIEQPFPGTPVNQAPLMNQTTPVILSAPALGRYRIVSITDDNGCTITAADVAKVRFVAPSEVVIGGAPPAFDAVPTLAVNATCNAGAGTTDPSLSFNLNGASTSTGSDYILTYQVNTVTPLRTKSFQVDGTGAIVMVNGAAATAITFNDAEFNVVGTQTLKLVSIKSPTNCLSLFNTNFSYTINPLPVGISKTVTGACTPSAINIDIFNTSVATAAGGNNVASTYTWTANFDGMTNSGFTGTGNIVGTLTNTTEIVRNAVFTVTPVSNAPASCTGGTFTITVPVNPVPSIPNRPETICSQGAFSFTPTNGGGAIVPAGTTYTWTIPTPNANITGATAQATKVASIGQTLINTSNAPASVTYKVTPYGAAAVGSCQGADFDVTVTVNPTPVIQPVTTAICSGTSFSVTPANGTPVGNIVPVNTTYTWLAPVMTGGVNGGTAQPVPQTSISQMLSNPSTSPGTATYQVLATSGDNGNCVATSRFQITVTVNPIPALSSGLTPPDVCNGTFTYHPTSFTGGATFSWTRAAVGGINEGATSGTGDIIDPLTNLLSTPIDVTYVVTTHANGCDNSGESVVVRLNPKPGSNAVIGPANVCVGTNPFFYSVTQHAGATYSWTIPADFTVEAAGGGAVPGGGPSAFSGDYFILLKYSTAAVGSIFVTEKSADGCIGDPNELEITAATSPPTVPISGGSSFCKGQTGVVFSVPQNASSTFTWSVGAGASIDGPSAGTNLYQIIVNFGTTHGGTTIDVTETNITGCPSNYPQLSVTLNPAPAGVDITRPAQCSNVAFNLSADNVTNGVTGSTFTWIRNTLPAGLGVVTAGTGSGPIAEKLVNLTSAVLNAQYTVTPTGSTGCVGSSYVVTVPINPEPVGANVIRAAQCSNAAFTIDPNNITNGLGAISTYTWTRNALPVGLTVVSGAGAGSGMIAETLRNLTSGQLSAVYVVTPTSSFSCAGGSYTVTIPINPEPVGADITRTQQCSNVSFSVSAVNITNGLGATSTYTWTRNPLPAGLTVVTGGSGTGGTITETIKNLSGVQLIASYTVTPKSADNCFGATYVISVPIDSEPVGADITRVAECSSVAFNVDPNNITNGMGATSTYTWVRQPLPAGLTVTVPGSGTGMISETLRNITAGTLNAKYTVTAKSADNCNSATYVITVPVNPEPVGANITRAAQCSNVAFSVSPDNITNGLGASSTYTWSRNPLSAGLTVVTPGTGTGPIAETLQNLTAGQLSATYTVTATTTAGSCASATYVITVPINPEPVGVDITRAAQCSNVAFSVSADNITNSVVGTTFSWVRDPLPVGLTQVVGGTGTGAIAERLRNQTGATLNAVYTVTPTTGVCAGATYKVTVPINPEPVGADITRADQCSNVPFSLSADNISNGVVGTTFTWVRQPLPVGLTVLSGGSGSGTIDETLRNLTGGTLNAVYRVTPTVGGCAGQTYDVTVPINPEPVGANITRAAQCSNVPFNVSANNITNGVASPTFTWTRNTLPAGLIEITPGTGIGAIAETLENKTGVQLSATYVVTPASGAGCFGGSYVVTVPINSEPVGADITRAVQCSNVPFSLSADNITNGLGATSSYAWTRNPLPAGLTVVTGTGSGTGAIAETLRNLTSGQLSATYVVTPTSAAGCAGATYVVTVPVNPEPVGADITRAAQCSNVPFSVSASNITNGVTGSTFTWTRNTLPPGITVVTAGSGSGAIAETLKNITAAQLSATYTVTATAASCAGVTYIVTVPINPEPIGANITRAAQCSNVPFSVSPDNIINSVGGSTFTWVRNALPAGIGVVTAGTGTGAIAETLRNLTGAQLTADYTVTPVSGAGCTGPSYVVSVPINPEPVGANMTAAAQCSDGGFSIDPNNVSNGLGATSTYAWTRNPLPVGLTVVTGTGTGTGMIAETLRNLTSGQLSAVYVVTPTSADGCAGATYNITIPVNPEPVGADITRAAQCSNITFSVSAVNITNGLGATSSYTWARNTLPGGLVLVTGGTGTGSTISEKLRNLTGGQLIVTYTVTPKSADNCFGDSYVISVPIDSEPVGADITRAAECSNVGFSVNPDNITNGMTGGTFTWVRQGLPGGLTVAVPGTGTGMIAETLRNLTSSPLNAKYTVTPKSADGCDGATYVITIPINPEPVGANITRAAQCSNVAFSVSPDNITNGLGATSTYTWTRNPLSAGLTVVTAGSGTGPIAETLQNLTSGQLSASYTVIAKTSSGCEGQPYVVTVPINPEPVGVDITRAAQCSNVPFSVSADNITNGLGSSSTYSWVRDPLPVGLTQVAGGSGTGAIAETLRNQTSGTLNAVYTVTPTSSNLCVGATYKITVPISPEPVGVAITRAAECSSVPFSVSPDNITNGVMGTTFTWVRQALPTGLTVLSGGSGSGSIDETLRNLTGGTLNAVYRVTPTVGGCTGQFYDVTVPINPEPVGANITRAAECSGVAFSVSPNNITNGVLGSTFTWVRQTLPAGLTEITPGTGAGLIAETLENKTSVQLSATYVVTPTSGAGCEGGSYVVTIPINPEPVGADITRAAECSNKPFSVSADNITNGLGASSTYTWVRNPLPVGLTQVTAGTGVGPIAETLRNLTSGTLNASYTVTPRSGALCFGDTYIVTIPISPEPVGVNITRAAECSNKPFSVSADNITNGVTGTTFTWVRQTLPVGLTQVTAGTGSGPIAETLRNITGASLDAKYTVTPTTGGCVGQTYEITIPINPEPVGVDITRAVECSNVGFNVSPNNITNGVGGSTFTWVRDNLPVGLSAVVNGSGTGTISETIRNITGGQLSVKYKVTPTSGAGCVGAVYTITVPINPEPVGNAVTRTAECSNVAFSVDPNNVTNGLGGTSTFAWTRDPLPVGLTVVTGTGTGTGMIAERLRNLTSGQLNAVYRVTPTSINSCVGDVYLVTIPINPEPVGADITRAAQCSNVAFSVSSVNIINSLGGTSTYTWSRNTLPAGLTAVVSGGGTGTTINETLRNVTGGQLTASYTVTPKSADGCFGLPYVVSVPVDSEPVGAAITRPAQCSGVLFSVSADNITNGMGGTSSYSWVRDPLPTGLTVGISGSGTGNISEMLRNLTSGQLSATYKVTPRSAAGCAGAVYVITVPIDPEPVGANFTRPEQCSNVAFSVSPDNISNGLGATSTYTWVRNPLPGGLTQVVGGSGTGPIAETLRNLSGVQLTASYVVTPKSAAGCEGGSYTIFVPVNSEPVGANFTAAQACSNASFSVNPSNITNGMTGITFAWTRQALPGGLTVVTGSGSGTGTITETLRNLSSGQLSAKYTVTPTSSAVPGCAGVSYEVTVPVNPEPVGGPVTRAAQCSDSPFSLSPDNITNGVTGVTFTWVRKPLPTGLTVTTPGNGIGPIAETLRNLTGGTLNAVYTVTPKAGVCAGATYEVTVPINGEPVMATNLDQTRCSDVAYGRLMVNNGTSEPAVSYDIEVISIQAGLTGTRTVGMIGTTLPANAIQNDAFTNTTSGDLKVVYRVTPHGVNCVGDPKDITFTISPEPVIPVITPVAVCSRASTNIVLATNGSSIAAQSYKLTNIQYSLNGGAFSTTPPARFTLDPGNITIGTSGDVLLLSSNEYINLEAFFVSVKYTVVPTSAGGCDGDPRDITIRINPEPDLDNTLNPADICSGETIVGGNPGYLLKSDPASVAATSFIINQILSSGLTPGPLNETTGTNKPADAINDDSWINTTNAPKTVTYKIIPVTNGCLGVQEDVVVNVNPSPAIKDGLSRIVCSDSPAGIVFQANTPTSVDATSYEIMSITVGGTPILPNTTVGGLKSRTGNAVAGITVDASEIAGDIFENATPNRIVVTYTVVPISDPLLNSCRGPAKVITLTVEPRIISASTIADADICSGEGIQITFASPTYKPSDPSKPKVTFSYTTLPSSISGTTVGNNLNEGDKITDVLVNSTNAPIVVTYRITPRASTAANGIGCDAFATQDILVKVQPRPKINTIANKTICDNTSVGLNIVSPTVPDAGVIKIFVTSTSDAGVTGAMNNQLVANNTLLGDVLLNPTDQIKYVTYHLEVRNVTSGNALICGGPTIDVTVGVSPRPVFTPALADFAICSGDSFLGIPITTNTDANTTSIKWTVTSNPGSVAGASPGAGDRFQQVLINQSNNKQVVTYKIEATNIASSPSCAGTPHTMHVTVYPNPKASNVPNSVNVCNNGMLPGNPSTPFTIKASTVDALGTTFDWPVPDTGGNPDLPPAAAGTNATTIPQVYVNNGETSGSHEYSIKAHLTMDPADQPLIDISQGLDNVCESQANATMIVNVAPPINADIFGYDIDGNEASEIFVCRGTTPFMYINPVGLALLKATYEENGVSKTLSKMSGLTQIPGTPTTTTTYELKTVTDAYNCTVPINKTLIVNVDEVDKTASIVGPTAGCSPFTVTFQHNQVAGSNYQWKWADGPDSLVYNAASTEAGKQIKHVYTTLSTSRITTLKPVLEIRLDTTKFLEGCRKRVDFTVQIYPTVNPAVFPNKDIMCSDETVAFSNSTQGTSVQHRWFYRVQGTTTELEVKTTPLASFKIPNTSNTNPLVYEVVYQSRNANCIAPEIVTPITVYRGVDAHFSHTPPTVFVGGHSTMTVTNDSSPVDSDFRYEWTFGLDADPETATGAGPSYVLDYTTPGPKELRLVATNILAESQSLICYDEYTETIDITVPPLIADFTAVPLRACFPTDITITENKATGDTFAWRVLDNAGTAGQSNAELPVFKIPAPGKYTIELTTSNSYTGDQKTATQDVIVYDLPMASFDFRPGLVYVPDTELTTYNFSDRADQWWWDFGDGTTDDTKEPTHTYKIEGVYDITLIAIKDNGDGAVCSDTLVRKVTAKQGGVTRVPNAFTPSPNGPSSSAGAPPVGNSFNDVFLPQVKGAEEFNMQVFDRWGNMVFESNNSNIGWDGYDKNGKLMPAGVYVYKLTLRLSDGQRTTQVGDITMIR